MLLSIPATVTDFWHNVSFPRSLTPLPGNNTFGAIRRGLPSEAGVALRRAFEQTGVLTHIWRDPPKLDALDVDSPDYNRTFRREFDRQAEKELKAARISKRFSAMIFGPSAKKIYDYLSTHAVHGGTGRRLSTWTGEVTTNTCSFGSRPEPDSKDLQAQLDVLALGHQALCTEFNSLCLPRCKPTDRFLDESKALIDMAPSNEQPRTVAMQTRINSILSILREEPAAQPPAPSRSSTP